MTPLLPAGAPIPDHLGARVPAADRLVLPDGRVLTGIPRNSALGLIFGAGSNAHEARAWQCADGMRVLASLDDTPHGWLLHVSVSYRHRDPRWRDLKAVRAAFFPDDADVMMVLPRVADYVNLHEHTFHLMQTPVVWGLR